MLEPSKINPWEKPEITLEQAVVNIIDNPGRTDVNCWDLVREMNKKMKPRINTFFWEKQIVGPYLLERKKYIWNTDIVMYGISTMRNGEILAYDIHIEKNRGNIVLYNHCPPPNERLLEHCQLNST